MYRRGCLTPFFLSDVFLECLHQMFTQEITVAESSACAVHFKSSILDLSPINDVLFFYIYI